MLSEEKETLAALRQAIQLEVEGKEYYLKASRESGNDFGRKLLETLAQEEDSHRARFELIFDAVRQKKGWRIAGFDGGKKLKALFDDVLGSQETKLTIKPGGTEVEAVEFAIGLENKTYDFYKAESGKTGYAALCEFYQALMVEENRHRLALLDYLEYLKNPAGWFVAKEHPSLDGA
ncbi:MAG: ferritin family protein [Chloroflexota bacterium]